MAAKQRARARTRSAYPSRTSFSASSLLSVTESQVVEVANEARLRHHADRKPHDLFLNEVVARLLATQLVHLQPAGAIRIKGVQLRGLSRKVQKVLDMPPKTASRRAITSKTTGDQTSRKKPAVKITGRYTRRTPAADPVDLREVTGAEVVRAAEQVYARTGLMGASSASQVLTDLVADQLVSRLESSPDLVDFDGGNLRDLSDEVHNVLPSLRLDNPWRKAIGPVYRAEAARALLGLSSRAELVELADKKAIVMLRTSDGHEVFPQFQFAGDRPLPGLAEVLQTWSADFERAPWTATAWLRTPLELLRGRTIVEAMSSGDQASVVDAATAIWGGPQE